ncbi:MAG TPA: hypothetical protein PK079_17380 [Leptospiraceae bacterium]|nr:hypothetical protein [Leptospiraceae bacterium]HMW06479.1 hypothetical protein [Leptospiraceae bacterium]HMX32419.1 hypothetical protein [Leptospiraceae bacterium]HMY33662.1 hypothetical protein [Leptospiraceae bacterium]HMZ65213.1 hypothetical protein [Leptospiraceae bacterium]
MPNFISNTSPILYLSKIELIEKNYSPSENFIIPNGVKEEILSGTVNDSAKQWIQNPENKYCYVKN